ncbi:hypothetical protein FOL47_006558 [Perkinsus chesapeaki]|uniref:NADP-dependent oxidoreductase domain-containing protein n=1 Tax=Perkinsus chesapeaki TaxID=330153 RepID=A0A7J6LQX0_PERCH|nr:hypothetical protein FOL47_006558 [Perkinsus chesapeaki]
MSSDMTVTLNNGMKMPIIGLGTYLTPDDVVPDAVVAGIKTGYRYIDTAFIYGNHHGVGQGIARAIKEGLVTREELFVTTKLWLTQFRPESVKPAVQQMLKDLQLDYVDQLLMHWPCPMKTVDGNMVADPTVKLTDTWRELEKLVDEGLVRSIGVSNFDTNEIDEILSMCRIKPVVDQIEVHPYFPQWRMLDYCKKHDIHVVAYAPLGSPANKPDDGSSKHNILEQSDVVEIAKVHNKSPAQVVLRWNIQRGVIVIPKSTKPARVVDNFKVFDFELSEPEMERINDIARDPKNRHRTFNPGFRAGGVRAFEHAPHGSERLSDVAAKSPEYRNGLYCGVGYSRSASRATLLVLVFFWKKGRQGSPSYTHVDAWGSVAASVGVTCDDLATSYIGYMMSDPWDMGFRLHFISLFPIICSTMSSAQQVPNVTLNNGMKMPIIGLGTFLTPDDVAPNAVVAGIKAGYRYIDTAFIYENHRGVGEGINQAIKEGLVTRDELFITTKLWMVFYRPDLVRSAVKDFLKELNLDYVDQILMHWPCPLELHDPAKDPNWKWPKNAKGEFDAMTGVKLSDTWRELEKCVDEGLVRSIGVSNFDTNEIDEILSMCRIKPAVDQIEVHPYFPQWRMLDYCKKHDIHVVAYAPLGSPANQPDDGSKKYNILEHPTITAIAKAHKKSPAQVCIRWNIQRGLTVIPKSTKPERVIENFQVFDFEHPAEEMERINAIGKDPKNRHRTFDCAFRPNGERAFDHVKAVESSYTF